MGTVLFSGGGSGGPSSDDCTATKAQVLSGYTAVTKDSGDDVAEGTMANQGAKTAALNCGASYTIPAGYHNGSGVIRANSLASQTGNATAEDKYVMKGKTYWKDGVLRTGTMETQSAISFSAAARSHNTIRISWKNPAKGPWQGVIIRMSTSGTPGTSGGTEKYRGAGNNPNQAGGDNYVDITGLDPSTAYYFTCTSYVTGLSNGTSANVQAVTKPKTVEMLWSEYKYPTCQTVFKRNYNTDSPECYSSIWTPSDNRLVNGNARTDNYFAESIKLNEMLLMLVNEYKPKSSFTSATMNTADIQSFVGRGIRIVESAGTVKLDLGKILTAELLEESSYGSSGNSYHHIYLTFTFTNALIVGGVTPYIGTGVYIEFY